MESLQCPLKREEKVLVFGSNHSKELSSSYTSTANIKPKSKPSSQSLVEIQYCLADFLHHGPFWIVCSKILFFQDTKKGPNDTNSYFGRNLKKIYCFWSIGKCDKKLPESSFRYYKWPIQILHRRNKGNWLYSLTVHYLRGIWSSYYNVGRTIPYWSIPFLEVN